MTDDIDASDIPTPQDTAASANPAMPETYYPFQFDGKGGEYFRIWIVNIALSIVTLGIYSAWATVRTRRYFYGKTSLDGTPFQFTAKPIPILIGRIIAFALFAFYSLLLQYNIVWGLVFLAVVIFPLMPWMIMKSMQFKARYTVWRNIPFRFSGGYWGAVVAFIVMSLAVVATLGILIPESWKASARYQFGHLHYGALDSRFPKGATGFWSTYGLLILFGILGYLVVIAGGLGLYFIATSMGLELDPVYIAENPWVQAPLIVLYLPFFLIGFWVQGRLFNASLGNTHFGPEAAPVSLRPGLPNWRYAWVLLTNLILTILTLGLFWPWAKVRETRYKLDHLGVTSSKPLDVEASEAASDVGAAGAEMTSDFGFDISLF